MIGLKKLSHPFRCRVSFSNKFSPFAKGWIALLFLVNACCCFEFHTESPLEHLSAVSKSLADITWKTTSGNHSRHAVESRSNRIRRDMFYFPSGSALTFQFKLKSNIYSSTSTTISIDQRLEVKFKLPTRSRRRRSISEDRSAIYSSLITLMDNIGVDGGECMRKLVCEAAESSLLHFGLMGEILHLILGAGHRQDSLEGSSTAENDNSLYSEKLQNTIQRTSNPLPILYQYTNPPNRTSAATDSSPIARNPQIHSSRSLSGDVGDKFDGPGASPNTATLGDGCDLQEFIRAENYGRDYGGCWAAYPNCRISMREIIFNGLASLSENNYILRRDIHDEL